MRIRSGYLLAGAATYVVGTTTAVLLWGPARPEHACASGAVWDELADTYDDKVGLDETLMGLKLLRRFVIRRAQV